jgi:pyruvate formate lyase activating enzyme
MTTSRTNVGSSLQQTLDARTIVGDLAQSLPNDRVRCVACGHRCVIPPGARGVCRVRFNRDGQLRVPFGYAAGVQVDPVEKKPFFHVLPGAKALSFGMLGCDFHCGYCQNWVTSQTLRDPASDSAGRDYEPGDLVRAALDNDCQLVVSTYNEPLITAEWAVAIFKLAKAAGLKTAVVSNGNATPEALDYLQPWIDAYKVDLKSMQDQSYRQLGGVLAHVKQTIRDVYERGIWTEVVTLVVPGFNDSDDELREAAEFLAGVSPDIPWHVTAFHPEYKMQDAPATTADALLRASLIGRRAGLRYVYPGNLPGRVNDEEQTRCPGCGGLIVDRVGFHIRHLADDWNGRCEGCGTSVPGIWN